MVLDKQEYREMLEDICSEYCERNHYCILKEFLVSSHPSPRLLSQLKCIDKYKFECSKAKGEDVGWQAAMESWVEEGYAIKFAEVWDEKKSFAKIYKEIMGRN